MSVESTHKGYQEHASMWQKCRDVIGGQEAVHAAGERYLPILKGQSRAEYAAYRKRALFYNATGRTLDGLSGLLFRKPPVETMPDALAQWAEDVTMHGVPVQGFAEEIAEEVMTVGRAGVLVDFPPARDDVRTQQQAAQANLRPYFARYNAENILDWKTSWINNEARLSQVRLKETVMEPEDEFSQKPVEQIRVLDLIEGRYRVRLYQKNEKTDKWEQIGSDVFPQMRGRPLSFIPFIFFGVKSNSPEVERPPLLDLVNVNVSHYQSTADLEHGAHFCGLPTPYALGFRGGDGDDGEVPEAIGPQELWHSENENASVGYLEFTGEGLKALETRIQRKEDQMAALGARMLSPEKREAEAAETHAMKRSGENAVLSSIAQQISSGMTKALTIAAEWLGAGGEVGYELNRDYLPQPMTPEMLKQLVATVQAGDMTFRTFFEQLKAGEIIAPDEDLDDYRSELETERL